MMDVKPTTKVKIIDLDFVSKVLDINTTYTETDVIDVYTFLRHNGIKTKNKLGPIKYIITDALLNLHWMISHLVVYLEPSEVLEPRY